MAAHAVPAVRTMAVATVSLRAWQRVILASAIALRLIEYFRNNSLWGDEAMLALNIATRSFRELLEPLAYAQVAPVPFLWAERLVILLLGANEWALRAIPLVAGIALCVLVFRIGQRMLRPEEALIALLLIGFSPSLLRYSAEVKPYSLDALLSVVMVAGSARVIDEMNNRRSWILLAALGAVAILFSLPSVFVCLGVCVALAVHAITQKRLNYLWHLCLVGLAWASLFALAYIRLYREGTNAPYMRSFWEGAFLVPGSAHLLVRAYASVADVSWGIYPGLGLLGLSGVTIILILLGSVALWRRRQMPYAILLLVPGLVPFVASIYGAYPIAMRLMLFAIPLFLMLAAIGVVVLARWVHGFVSQLPVRWVATLVLLPAIITGLASLLIQRDQQMRPLLLRLFESWKPGDAVYVFHRVVPIWLFYSTDWAAPNIGQLIWAMRVSGPGGPGHENGPSRGRRPAGEGSELVYQITNRQVLLGTSSGVQGRPMFGQHPREPDIGWAGNEAKRIREAASPRAWVVLGNASHEGTDLAAILLKALIDEGGSLTFGDSLQDGRLYRFEFSPVGPR